MTRGMEDGYGDGKGDGNREILGETGMGKVESGYNGGMTMVRDGHGTGKGRE